MQTTVGVGVFDITEIPNPGNISEPVILRLVREFVEDVTPAEEVIAIVPIITDVGIVEEILITEEVIVPERPVILIEPAVEIVPEPVFEELPAEEIWEIANLFGIKEIVSDYWMYIVVAIVILLAIAFGIYLIN